ncbi:unnamed protein product, partial [Ectocarpus sp. 4 AP-2014]
GLGGNEQLARLFVVRLSRPSPRPRPLLGSALRNGVPPGRACSDRGALAQFRLPCGNAEWRKRSHHPGYRRLRRRSRSLHRGAGSTGGRGGSSSSTKHVRRASMGRGLGVGRRR